MSVHNLKTWPLHFRDITAGRKTFEVRKNDRGYQVGDLLVLQEYSPSCDRFTGSTCKRVVSYILPGGQFGIADNHVVMALVEGDQEWCCEPLNGRVCVRAKGHVQRGNDWHDDGHTAWITEAES